MKKLLCSLLLAGTAVLFAADAYPAGDAKKDKPRIQIDTHVNCNQLSFKVEDGKGVCTVKYLKAFNDPQKKIKDKAYMALFFLYETRADKTIGSPVKPNKKYRCTFDLRRKGKIASVCFAAYGLKSGKSVWDKRVPLGKSIFQSVKLRNENWNSYSFDILSGAQANAVITAINFNNNDKPVPGDEISIRNLQIKEIK